MCTTLAEVLKLATTEFHPNYVDNPHNGESSGSYNKPAAVMHWVQEAKIQETYVLFIDADMCAKPTARPLHMLECRLSLSAPCCGSRRRWVLLPALHVP